jgi:myosin heavy subunit
MVNNNMTTAKKNSINKILVVGHEQSEYKSVLKLLNAAGMGLANPSARDGMQADEISKTILKNFQNNSSEITQLSVSPVWNGLALDLMMANIEKPMWCWADPSSVSLLNYWKSLDSQLAFVFVYDNPNEFILKNFSNTMPLSAEAIKTKVNEWCLYNKALLNFYNRNKESSLLVNSQQISEDSKGYLQYVEDQIGIPLLIDTNLQNDSRLKDLLKVETEYALGDFSLREESIDKGLSQYLADELLQQFPQITELYEELESVANLPSTATHPLKASVYDAWVSLSATKKNNQKILKDKATELEKIENKNKKLDEQVTAYECEKKSFLAENELLLTQLHTVQEELEQSEINTQQTVKDKTAELEKIENENKKLDKQVTAYEREKKSFLAENELLLTQLHTVQEELEQSEINTQQTAKDKATELEKIENDNKKLDGQVTAYEREKKSSLAENELLLTQLHTVQEELEQSDINTQQTVKDKTAELEKIENENKKLDEQVSAYESEKKGHLQESELLLAELHAVQEELEIQYIKNTKPKLYGAANRVKNQLSYRLGAAMIENSKSTIGILKTPFTLRGEVKKFRLERSKQKGQKLPSIDKYSDAHEAEKIKRHLSYMLGQAMVKNKKTPLGWFKLPFALKKAHAEYKKGHEQ